MAIGMMTRSAAFMKLAAEQSAMVLDALSRMVKSIEWTSIVPHVEVSKTPGGRH